MSKSVGGKIRHVIEALSSAFLLLFQHIPVAGPWRGFMIIPLAGYVFGFFWEFPEFRGQQIYLLLVSPRLMFGRVVAIAGFIIFIMALIQLLAERGRLVTWGLYSVVRHPQYFGLSIMTLGINMMAIQFGGRTDISSISFIWLIQVIGYILLAGYEERHLVIDYQKEYKQYKEKVSFLFPTPHFSKIPEILVSIIIASIIAFLLMLI